MNVKHARKFVSILSSLSLLFQSFGPGLYLLAKPVFAEDLANQVAVEQVTPTPNLVVVDPIPAPTEAITSTPIQDPTPTLEVTPILPENPAPITIVPVSPAEEPTITPISEPTVAPTETPVVTPVETPVPTPTIAVVEKDCFTGTVVDSTSDTWNTDLNKGISETKEKVKAGVKYLFPLENKVSVTFNCLPKDESLRTNLKIEQVKIGDLKLPQGTNPVGDYAFDITTGMTDGTFEYDVTLPNVTAESVDVSYIEKSAQDAKDNPVSLNDLKLVSEDKLSQDGEVIKAVEVDHFTIFIVTTSGNGPTLTTALVNNQTQVTVTPNTSITANLTVTTSGNNNGNDWKSTAWKINNGSWQCLSTPNHTSSGTYTESVAITAPSTVGIYDVSFRAYYANNCSGNNGTYSSTVTLIGGITVAVSNGVANPILPQTCGLDIALVFDGSGSIDDSEYSLMQGAFVDFAEAFLPGTPTEMSIVEFASSSIIRQGFTSNKTTLINEINKSRVQPGGQYTNYKDGLISAHSLFANRSNPDLIVFASDGNPNRPNESTALAEAITEANSIKSDGVRIITIGIGNGLDSSNLIAISSADAYYASNFDTLAGTLAGLASDLCGGTITVNKYIDQVDPNNRGGANWMFNVSGPNNYSNNLGTDANGQDNTGVIPSGGGYSVTEIGLLPGYSFSYAVCRNQTEALEGSVIPGGVGNIDVGNSDIISCDFINTENKGSLQVGKAVDSNNDGIYEEADSPAPDLGFRWSYNGDLTERLTGTQVDLPYGNYTVTEKPVTNYSFTGWYSKKNQNTYSCTKPEGTTYPVSVTVSSDADASAIILCNAIDTGTLNVFEFRDDNKNLIQDAGEPAAPWFDVALYTGNDCSGSPLSTKTSSDFVSNLVNFGALTPGNYSVKETIKPEQAPWINVSPLCQNITVGAGETKQLDFGNYYQQQITVCLYNDINGDGLWQPGDSALSGWTVNLAGPENLSGTTTGDGCARININIYGGYEATEVLQTGWTQTFPASPQTAFVNANTSMGLQMYNHFTGVCGNGQKEADEICDGTDGVTNANFRCTDSCTLEAIPYCGDGKLNQTSEQCDGVDGVTQGQNFCTQSCKLIPIYSGSNVCSAGKTPVKIQGPISVSGTNPTPVTVTLPSVSEYLIEATGDYGYGGDYPNNTINRADAGYATGDTWATRRDNLLGIPATAQYRGITSLLSDMGTGNMGIVNWGAYSQTHNYKFNYTPLSISDTNLKFVISDWYDTWYSGDAASDTNKNQAGMWDNAGNLNINVYECKNQANVTFTKIVDFGPGQPSDWTFGVYDSNGGLLADTYSSGNTYPFDLGTYNVTESTKEGYSLFGASGICSINPTNGKIIMTVSANGGTCTITNKRDMGSLKVNKRIDLNGDGDWNDTDESSNSYANSHGFGWVLDGVGKTFGTSVSGLATNLSNYYHNVEESMPGNFHFVGWYINGQVGKSCTNPNGTTLPLGSQLQITKNQLTEITFCNAHNTGTITVVKSLIPTTDSGKFNLRIDGSTKKSDAGNNGTTNAVVVTTGNHTVSETAGTRTDLDDYSSSISCDNGAHGNGTSLVVSVNASDNVVCTITNTRYGSITIVKDAHPDSGDNFNFTRSWGTDFALNDDGHGSNSTTFSNKLTGNYTVTENAKSGWYLNSIVCSSESVVKDLSTRSVTINLATGQNVTCTFNNYKFGKIEGYKFNDKDGDRTKDHDENGLSGWTITLDEGQSVVTDSHGYYFFSNLTPGNHTVCETPKEGWTNSTPLCQTTEIDIHGGDIDTVNFGNYQPLQVVATKITCDNEADLPNWGYGSHPITSTTASAFLASHPNCRVTPDWQFQYNLNPNAANPGDNQGLVSSWTTFGPTDAGGQATFNVTGSLPSKFWVREAWQNGYIPFTYNTEGRSNRNNVSAEIYCDGDQLNYDNYDFVQSPRFGQTYYCVAFNALNYGDVTVTKYEDKNGNGQRDEGETLLSGWEINLKNETASRSATTAAESGQATFNDVLSGSYNLSETLQPYWEQTNISCDNNDELLSFTHEVINTDTSNNHPIRVGAGQTVNCEIGNKRIEPRLIIEKTNNASGDKYPGENVLFTITVTATQSGVNNVTVIDLPSLGFKYHSGSWTASSSVRGDLKGLGITTEPTYASPGTWILGDMVKDEIVTLTYIADISNDQEAGLYKDLAWAKGRSLSDNLVMANDTTGYFVGTKVNVVRDYQNSASVNIEREEISQVLGASTSLPETGLPTRYLALVALLSIISLGLLALGLSMKKGHKFGTKVISGMFLGLLMAGLFASSAFAANVSVKLEEPKTPSYKDNFKLTFVALDLLDRQITVKCFKKGPSDVSASQFGSDIILSSGGNSGNCNVDSGVVTAPGTYTFHVDASVTDETATSSDVSVEYKTSGPGTPTSYSKEQTSSCEYKIKFKTADDGGKTVRVEIYRSDTTTFNTDAGARVGTVAIGSNQEGSFTNGVPDCGKTYYYVIRAYDDAGNGSGVIGDSIVKIVNVLITQNPTQAQGAIPVSGGNVGGGSVLGEAGSASTSGETLGTGTESGTTSGNAAGETENLKTQTQSKLPWILGLTVVAGAAITYYVKRKRA